MPNAPAAPAEVTVNVLGLVLCGIALVVSVYLNVKKRYPLGIMTMVAAFLIGTIFLNMQATAIINAFPTTIVMPLFLAIPFFSMLASTGMLTIVGKRLLRLVRGDIRKLPLFAVPAIGIVSFVASSQIPFIFGPLLVGMAAAGGMDYMIIAVLMAFAGAIGALNPWTTLAGQMINGMAMNSGAPNAAGMPIAVWFNVLAVFVLLIVFAYFIFKGHKAQRVVLDESEDLSMNQQQKTALWIFIISICLLLVPPILYKIFPKVPFFFKLFGVCNNNIIFAIGILVCVLLKFDTFEGCMKKIPMTMVFMIVGITMLLKVADTAGFSKVLSDAISQNIPVMLIPALFTLAACVLSFFATAFTVLPILWAIAVPVAAATGINPAVLLTGIAMGAFGAGQASPLSAGGALILSVFPVEEQDRLSKRMLVFALFACVWFAVFALVGFFNVGAALFA